jgi:hypothetical protein
MRRSLPRNYTTQNGLFLGDSQKYGLYDQSFAEFVGTRRVWCRKAGGRKGAVLRYGSGTTQAGHSQMLHMNGNCHY